MIKVKRALLSVSDKSGLKEFARKLAGMGVEFISTGGTAKALAQAGLAVKDVSQVTGFPEMLDGRVKTLHPKVHGGILARRDLEAHMAKLVEMEITPIDLVVVNLYPFQQTVADPDCKLEDAVENIDIGGPTLIRASAKNYGGVAILTDPADYAKVVEEMEGSGGSVSRPTRWLLAKKAYAMTAAYDKAITENLPRWDGEEGC